jgi:L-proline amide hydrolase
MTFTWTHDEVELMTWYRIVGNAASPDRPPIIMCHGGPGFGHDYLEPAAELLAVAGWQCVLYDQVGCGNSSHLPDAPTGFWSVQLFKDELVALLAHLGISDRYIVLGQSWGGMLAMEHALTNPAGLGAIVVCDSPASIPLWVAEADRLRMDLPPDVEATLRRHEAAGSTDDPAYEAAVRVFYDRHVCRIPWPEALNRSAAQEAADPTVYHTMNGPSEFHVVGVIRDWDITADLHRITVPTLLVSGRFDEATPTVVGQIHERVPGAQWSMLEHSSHLPHLEEPAGFRDHVVAFLETLDAPPAAP